MPISRISRPDRRRSLASRVALFSLATLALGACTADHDRLLEEANSDRIEVRAAAIMKIGQDPWPNDDAVLFKAAGDKASMVRLAAAKSLYMSEDPKVYDLMGGLIDDPVPEIQEYAVKSLLRPPVSPKSLAYVRNAYVRKGDDSRRIVGRNADVEQLRSFVQRESAETWEKALKELSSAAPARQETAARLIGASGRDEARDILLARLTDPDTSVPLLAGSVAGLAALGAREAVPRIIGVLEKESQPAIRLPLIQALGALAEVEAIPALAAIAQSSEATEDALAALTALERIHAAHPGVAAPVRPANEEPAQPAESTADRDSPSATDDAPPAAPGEKAPSEASAPSAHSGEVEAPKAADGAPAGAPASGELAANPAGDGADAAPSAEGASTGERAAGEGQPAPEAESPAAQMEGESEGGPAVSDAIPAPDAPPARSFEGLSAGDVLCRLLADATPKNAVARAKAVQSAGLECDLSFIADDLNLGGTAAQASLRILSVLPQDAMADALLALLAKGDGELVADVWSALSKVSHLPSVSAELKARIRTALDGYAAAHAKWISPDHISGFWLEDEFEDAKKSFHDHGRHDDIPDALDVEALRSSASLSPEELNRMAKETDAARQKALGKKSGMAKLMERMDKAAKARAEALGFKPGQSRDAFFEYGDELLDDLSEADSALFNAQMKAAAYLPDLDIPETVLWDLWRDPQMRRISCEIAGARLGRKVEDRAGSPSMDPAASAAAETGEAPLNPSGKNGEAAANPEAEGSAPTAEPTAAESASASSAAPADAHGSPSGDGADGQAMKLESRTLDVAEIARRCLRSRIQDDMEAVLAGLERQGDAAISPIVEVLGERTEQRSALIKALARIGASEQVKAAIRPLMAEGGDDGLVALEAAVALNDQEAVPALMAKLKDPALRERRQVIDALGFLAHGNQEVTALLAEEIFSGAPEIRLAALRALGRMGTLKSAPKAAALAEDYFADVRKAAAGK